MMTNSSTTQTATTQPSADQPINFDIAATIDAANLIDSKRMELYRSGHHADAVTGILYRAALGLNAQARAALTGKKGGK